jgi:hypothetical protein
VTRTLRLDAEHLIELSAGDLGGVRAAGLDLPSGLTCPLRDCFVESNLGTCWTWAC